jgi:hypothetical protein
MKFNSRLLIRDLCAAGATALLSAVLIVGCATGQRTGKFWEKGDVGSADAYVQAETAKDQAVVANKTPAPGAGGKVAPASGTQDKTAGHVDFSDIPDPTTAPPSPSGAAPAMVDAGSTNAGRVAQTAVAATSGPQAAGSDSGGSIVAPYVQKRAPSGVVDNSQHDGEIVKPKAVFAKQLDPFAETDAEPFVASPSSRTHTAPPVPPVANSVLTPTPTPAPPAPTQATRSNGNPFAEDDGSLPPVVPTKGDLAQSPTKPLPTSPAAPSGTAAVAVPAAATDVFDLFSAPPPPTPGASASATPPATSQPAAMTPAVSQDASATAAMSKPAPVPIAVVKPAITSQARPQSAIVTPAGRRFGVRLDDEELNEAEPSPTRQAEAPVVEQAATQTMQAVPEAQAAAVTTPYENDTSACVAPPQAPVKRPASVSAPAAPSPAQDAWESTQTPKPASSAIRRSVPAPAPVRTVAPAPVTSVPVTSTALSPTTVTPTVVVPARVPSNSAPQSVSVTKTAARSESPSPAKPHSEPDKTRGPSDPMICDSASARRRYIGDVGSPTTTTLQKSHNDDFGTAVPSSPATPADKKSHSPVDGKSAACWDDPFVSPALKQRVSTADFSIPATPGSLSADDGRSIAAPSAASAEQANSGDPAHNTRRTGSHAWFVIGMIAGLAVSAVFWRHWRQSAEPQPG